MTRTLGHRHNGRRHGSRTSLGVGLLAVAIATIGALLVAGPLSARSGTVPAGNLVKNPGAEEGPGSPDSTQHPAVPGWTTTPSFTAVKYGTSGFPTTALGAQIGGGQNIFAGGPNNPRSSATQTVDVAGAAAEIDGGQVQAPLSALIGGFESQEDNGIVEAFFLNAAGGQLGSVKIGPVTAADRGGKTTLLPRSATGLVPAGTRSIRVVVTATRVSGSYNDGYLDNVDLELKLSTAPPPARKPTLAVACSRHVLVVTVRRGAAAIKSVAFLVNGKRVAIDRKAPFTARVRTAGLAAQLHVTARVQSAGETVVLRKAIHRC
ncbi:MAG: hypothetical protein ACXW0F_02725 [Gaiellaceae bacterium]